MHISKKFKVPYGIKQGDYIIYAKVSYNGKTATSSDLFKVRAANTELPIKTKANYLITTALLGIAMLVAIAFMAHMAKKLHSSRKRRKKIKKRRLAKKIKKYGHVKKKKNHGLKNR